MSNNDRRYHAEEIIYLRNFILVLHFGFSFSILWLEIPTSGRENLAVNLERLLLNSNRLFTEDNERQTKDSGRKLIFERVKNLSIAVGLKRAQASTRRFFWCCGVVLLLNTAFTHNAIEGAALETLAFADLTGLIQ